MEYSTSTDRQSCAMPASQPAPGSMMARVTAKQGVGIPLMLGSEPPDCYFPQSQLYEKKLFLGALVWKIKNLNACYNCVFC